METGRFEGLTEEAVAALAQNGDRGATDYLVFRYTPQISQMVRSFYLNGGELEDLVQEGLIGLYEAVKDFDPGQNVKFRTFATLCIRRQLFSAMESANRDKHKPLNTYVPFSNPDSDLEREENPEAVLKDAEGSTPLDQIIDLETLREYSEHIEDTLTPLELTILVKYLEGSSYKEISRSTGRNPKSVDNAIQRIRKKLSSKR